MRCPLPNSSSPGSIRAGESSRSPSATVDTAARATARLAIRITLLLVLTLSTLHAAAVELDISTDRSTSGTFDLSWQGTAGETYRLVQLSGGDKPRLIYEGTDTARVMTGLSNGDYTYQVLGETGQSEPRRVTVAHHSLARAFSFFGIGLLVFVATVILVVRGDRGQ